MRTSAWRLVGVYHIEDERKQHRLWHHIDNVHRTNWIDWTDPFICDRCKGDHYSSSESCREAAQKTLDSKVSCL